MSDISNSDTLEPKLVRSGKSMTVAMDGRRFSIEVFRHETDQTWTLRVVDDLGRSHTWGDPFQSDRDARDTAIRTLDQVGADLFSGGDNILPFRKS